MTNNNNKIIAAGTYHSDKFEYVNQKLREHFQRSQDEIEKVKEKVNELVSIVHKDNKEWSLKKICDYIAGKNDDLEYLGFSSRTIYNYLNEENRQLLDNTGRPRKMLQNKDIEQRFESLQTNVIEESSRTLPTAYEVKEAETVGEAVDDVYNSVDEYEQTTIEKPRDNIIDVVDDSSGESEVIYDPSYVRGLEEENVKLRKDNEELKKDNEELESKYSIAITPYQYTDSIEGRDGQEIPLIAKPDPYKKGGTIEIDYDKVKKMGLNRKR